MDQILFEHNHKAYESAVSMIKQTGKAAVVHPTGTGKSFIAFQLCADNKDKNVCWLSPSEYIFETQKEKWLSACGNAAGGSELDHVAFITYARLMRMKEEELAALKPDYIILDEFHRCGALQWGKGVERLREMYPAALVLGLSATSIRYLDNQRDMAWELFDGNIASELTLGAAVAQGILPAPKYVLSVYSYRRELKKQEARVRQAKNPAVRDAAEKELEALRRALEKADGLEEIFARHMLVESDHNAENKSSLKDNYNFENGRNFQNRTKEWEAKMKEKDKNAKKTLLEKPLSFSGKYIVFCASYEHLCEMRELAPEWFAKVDAEPHIYTAYSDDPSAAEEFQAFKADRSEHLKLLYCIDMLNEGIHVDEIDGVILLRPTVSPTIYKQQIGRALAAGGKKTPVIFDVVMNIENLCSIGVIEEELREAVFAYRANDGEDKVVQEHFQVIDEVQDARRLFMQLNETLGASWEAMYGMAKEYSSEHGNLEVPVHYVTPEGYSLGAWINTQRKVFTGKTAGVLSEEQIKRLTAIGMRWQGVQERAWERNFAEAERYFQEHGDLNVPADYVAESGCRLGRWVRRQRETYQKRKINACEGQICGEKRRNVPSEQECPGSRQEVYSERMERLTRIGMIWENPDSWEQKFELAKQYYREHGNLKMPADYVVEGVWLDRWLREQKARMEEEAAAEGNAAKEKGAVTAVKTADKNISGINLQRENGSQYENHLLNKNTSGKFLTKEQKEKLVSIGIRPGVSQAELSWREQYGEAEEFYRTHGNLAIPKRYAAGNGKNLSVWLQHQRANRRSGRLAGWQVRMLDGIGMVWESPDAWETGFAHAEEYVQKMGDLQVPNAYLCADGYRLGKWISNQRCAYRGIAKSGLSAAQVERLEEIGMVWSVGQGRRAGKMGQVLKEE